jgi:ABC-type transport system involved in multi-copper enzyme maturation permease subunit
MAKTLKLSNPAYASAVAYLVMIIVILLPFDISPVVDSEVASTLSIKYNFGQRLYLVLLMVIPIALSIYTINCFVVGKCVIWSWIHAVIVVIWVLLFVMGAILYTTIGKDGYEMFKHHNKLEMFEHDDKHHNKLEMFEQEHKHHNKLEMFKECEQKM